MIKKILAAILLISSFSIIGCSNSNTKDKVTKKHLLTASSDTSSSIKIPFLINDSSYYTCPFTTNNNSLIFANWEDDNKISLVDYPLSNTIIKTEDITDFKNYSTNSLAMINDTIYFANFSNKSSLSSMSLSDNDATTIINDSVSDIIAFGSQIYYIDLTKNHNLYCYDTESKINSLIISDKVGKYMINGDFILYQNKNDNDKLYKVRLDGSEKDKLTDFAVDSFITYSGMVLTVNLSDNNRLYSINPNDFKATRISLTQCENIKTNGNEIFFSNLDDQNHLYTLKYNSTDNTTSETIVTDYAINDYFVTTDNIYLEKAQNINNEYIIVLPINR